MSRYHPTDFFGAIQMASEQYQLEHAEIFGIVEGVALPVYEILESRRLANLAVFISHISLVDTVTTQQALHHSSRNGRLVMDENGVFSVNRSNEAARQMAQAVDFPNAKGRSIWRSALREAIDAQIEHDVATEKLNKIMYSFGGE